MTIWFEAADRALGLDWFGLLDWLKVHASASFVLRHVYLSLMPQVLVVVLALAMAERFDGLRVFMLAFIFAALMTIAISALWPAEGVWLLHGLNGAAVRINSHRAHRVGPSSSACGTAASAC